MAWAHVQGAGADQSGTTGTLAYPGSNTSGSLLQAAVRLGSGGSLPIVSDPTNGTWNKRADFTDSVGDRFSLHDVINTATSALTVTLANTTSVTRRWTIEEYTQTGTLSHDASGAGNTTTSATTLATDGVTTATDDELLAGGIQRSDGSSANTGASGTTVIRNVATGKTASGYKVIATAAAGQVLNFSWTTNDVAGCCASAFKATAAAGRTTKNTRAWPLGTEIGMNWRVPC